jgi:hypothetical protein
MILLNCGEPVAGRHFAWIRSSAGRSKLKPAAKDFEDIMDCADESPFLLDLRQSSQSEFIKIQSAFDLSNHRLDDALA